MNRIIASPAVSVYRRREQLDSVDDRRLRALVRSGEWARVTAGIYVQNVEWMRLRPHERHLVLVEEVARRMRAPAVLSHCAAAAGWGIDLLGAWPGRVDVRTERTSGGRTHGAIRRHALGLEGVDVVRWGVHLVTSPAQTALDLARSLPFVNAVAAVDQALWARRPGGSLTTLGEILRLLDAGPPQRGDARARRVLAEATHLADNVRETESRIVIKQLGFPTPRLQERRVLPSGRIVYGDFFFPGDEHWGELDGRGKYRSPDFGRARDMSDIVIDEKNRENEIRRIVRGFSRWEPADVADPVRLYDILTRDGLPSRLPRPSRTPLRTPGPRSMLALPNQSRATPSDDGARGYR